MAKYTDLNIDFKTSTATKTTITDGAVEITKFKGVNLLGVY